MPQLNPAPWFLTLVMSWVVLLVFLYPKTISALPQETPTHNQMQQENSPWNWPWT